MSVTLAALLASADVASAACSGAAPAAALQTFNGDPAAWLKANGAASDVGPQVAALAAAAVNANDAGFGKNLGAVLGLASADQGKAIGSSLGALANSCSDPRDPTSAADKRYISTNIAPNVLTNAAANTSYGQASNGTPQTASTGGGGAGGNSSGGGVGATGAGLPAGGSNPGSAQTGGTGTPNSAGSFSTSGGSGSSASTVTPKATGSTVYSVNSTQ